MADTALQLRRQSVALSGLDQWHALMEQAAVLVRSGFLPSTIRTPEQAAAIMLKGQELGVPPMYALSNIVVIKGKPTCNAELMQALIYREQGDNALIIEETTDSRCTISYARRAWQARKTASFTMEDAKRAQLLTNETWTKYPAAMLRARCISAVARMAFADCIGGMYTPEELGAVVAVDDATGEITYAGTIEGEAREIPAAQSPQPAQQEQAAPRMDPQIKAAMKRYADAASEAGHATKAAQRAWAEVHSAGRPLEALSVADWDVLAASVVREFMDGPVREWTDALPAMADSETGEAP